MDIVKGLKTGLAVLCALAFSVPATAEDDIPMEGNLSVGEWQYFLHLGADFEADSLAGWGMENDFLSGHGGEGNQFPYAGQTFDGLTVRGQDGDVTGSLTWTPAYKANGDWQVDIDYYNKYLHVYVDSPVETNVTIFARSDDNLAMWLDGEKIIDQGYTDWQSHSATFRKGVNSVTVRIREQGGGQFACIKIADPAAANAAFAEGTFKYHLHPGLIVVDAVSGSALEASSGEVKILRMLQSAEYAKYRVYQVGSTPGAWRDYDPATIPTDTIPYVMPSHPGDPIAFTIEFRSADGSKTASYTREIDTYNANVTNIAVATDTIATLSGSAVGRYSANNAYAAIRYGTDPEALDKSATFDTTMESDGLRHFSGEITGLSNSTVYYYTQEIFEDGQAIAFASGSFMTLTPIDFGDFTVIGGSMKMLDGECLVTFADGDRIIVSRPTTLDILLVGGGGGGGVWVGGGGGGGGVVYRKGQMIPAGKYEVKVGEGGSGASWDGTVASENGGNTLIVGLDSLGLCAYGGGAGGGSGYNADYIYGGSNYGQAGGSGGGSSGHVDTGIGGYEAGFGVEGQGNAGGTPYLDGDEWTEQAGGGGGAGGPGGNATNKFWFVDGGGSDVYSLAGGAGGAGRVIDITGEDICYGGGGGGGSSTYGDSSRGGDGGVGGGGNGGWLNSGTNFAESGSDGQDGLGGGGGGAGKAHGYGNPSGTGGGNGGRGFAIIRFTPKFAPDSKIAKGGEMVKKDGWMIHTFRESGEFTIPNSVVGQVLLVGGGGGGGNGYGSAGGGGGGGMLVVESAKILSGKYQIVVGKGGRGGVRDVRQAGENGGDSVFGEWTAFGGGGGGGIYNEARAGGSGGGAFANKSIFADGGPASGGAAFEGQGFPGGDSLDTDGFGAGGGGAGGPGEGQTNSRPGKGGDGRMCDFSGEEVYYAGGGAGGGNANVDWNFHTEGGLGGGGFGGYWPNGGNVDADGVVGDGVDGLGGGGGGGAMWGNGNLQCRGGNGGSGIVIIRYKIRPTAMVIHLR